MKHTEVVSSTESYKTCDFCEQRIEGFRNPCYGCGKDACKSCSIMLEADLFTGEGYGDYRTLVCNRCHGLALPYLPAANASRSEYESFIEELEERWKKECRTSTGE